MFKGKSILAVVPARGGSKGIKLKNLLKIEGVTLVERVAKVIAGTPIIDEALVSTDHIEIAKVATSAGLAAPFLRPTKLSGDRVSDIPVLTHSLFHSENKLKKQFDVILMLQPTSPFRRPADIDEVCEKLFSADYDSVLTVSPTDTKFHPLKQLVLAENNVEYFDLAGKDIVARQELSQLYHRNGLAYAVTRECLLTQKTLIGQKCAAVITSRPVPNIDTMDDVKFAEYILQNK